MVGKTRSAVRAAAMLIAVLGSTAALASLSIYVSPEDLARRADLVVEGRVIRTASGYDPLRETLATYVTLEVETVHRGHLESERLTLREPGGSYGALVHEVDAVPNYTLGETVLVFLEPAPDGALRTAGMFFGKYRLVEEGDRGARTARRDLEGNGLILGGATERLERIPLGDLKALIATTHREGPAAAADRDRVRHRTPNASTQTAGTRGRAPACIHAEPPEFAQLQWDDVREDPGRYPSRAESAPPMPIGFAERPVPAHDGTAFVPMSDTNPTRWYQADSGLPVLLRIDRAGNPLGDGSAAASEMRRAVAAWTNVPESRLALQVVNDDYDYTGDAPGSPAAVFSGSKVILFGDPYEDISDPTGCAGVLAIGGYWRFRSTGDPVNNVAFHPAVQLYVIFNDNFECFLGDAENLSEVAAHELGHGLGFGHSTAPDAIMRSTPYGNRGPRLGDDDRDGAHCHYPHTIELISPNGGESLAAGSFHTITWSITSEQGPLEGEVDLEYSTDGGMDWTPIRQAAPNDGAYDWLVPNHPGPDVRVRVVRHHRAGSAPAGYPEACSLDGSDASLTITAPEIVAGSIPAGPAGGGLAVALEPSGELRLSWPPSCSADADDFAIYEGSLAALRSGSWDHLPRVCSAGPDLAEYLVPQGGDRYYLIAPVAAGSEGTYGTDSEGSLRPESAMTCAPRESSSGCR